MNKRKNKLRILSIFLTVDGEVNVWGQGGWSVFIRTAGCGVGCHWCDTKYSWNAAGGVELLPCEIVDMVTRVGKGVKKVTITGGEPLEQDHGALAALIRLLWEKKYRISMETAGTQNTLEFRMDYSHMLPIKTGDLSFVVDYKLASSKFKGRMDIENHFSLLPRGDFVKFVIDDHDDFWEADQVAAILDAKPNFKARMVFSPSHGVMSPSELFNMMVEAGLPQRDVGINLQMHKYLFPDDSRNEEDRSGFDFTKRTLGRREFLDRLRAGKDV